MGGKMMRLFTIGFTKKKAREFFGLLSGYGATALVDIRGSSGFRVR
ncbi:MAG: hypothetical protein L0L12_02485 [Corynebacterium casei]|nr:hypothetical protein [Corynebacterium casei]MDN5705565.1 hypothetical protein [Corynebacterium casei]MDN5739840.1 hypothetical protein [Corynebacterium casei]MDN5883320.1 hypothetical protein [Corynebacterium casei]MDN5901625.1 hypothetical protein [Corynebacterium casei]MDN6311872.1 hypothetical protein [Corynebacterium casei]